jgi:hypothetical protein
MRSLWRQYRLLFGATRLLAVTFTRLAQRVHCSTSSPNTRFTSYASGIDSDASSKSNKCYSADSHPTRSEPHE